MAGPLKLGESDAIHGHKLVQSQRITRAQSQKLNAAARVHVSDYPVDHAQLSVGIEVFNIGILMRHRKRFQHLVEFATDGFGVVSENGK